jgi:hypothetical protein
MLKSVATTLLNRLVLLAAIMLVVNAYTPTSCSSGDGPFAQIGKAMSSLNEIATALQKR